MSGTFQKFYKDIKGHSRSILGDVREIQVRFRGGGLRRFTSVLGCFRRVPGVFQGIV